MEIRRLINTSAFHPSLGFQVQHRDSFRPQALSARKLQSQRKNHAKRRWRFQCRSAAVQSGSTALPAPQPSANFSLEGKLKCVGLGARGAGIVSRLLQSSTIDSEHAWYVDAEECGKHLARAPTRLQLSYENNSLQISMASLQRLVGSGAYDSQGKGNINTGDGGIAFIVTSAACVPGGADLVLSLIRQLRGAGFFTVVAMASPFEFEGSRKTDSANRIIEEVHNAAHLVSVVEQNALIGVKTNSNGLPMTVDEATNISDNALEHTVRCIMAAVQAPEVLDSSRGALIWHGSEMKRFKRLLSPPLQHLLTRPARSALGRGSASMSKDLVSNMGMCQALMRLATDAVRAAVESPFLEGFGAQATRALCCVTLPSGQQSSIPGQDGRVERAAARLAVQAAAGALMQVTECKELVMWYTSVPHSSTAAKPGQISIEVSLLMLTPEEVKAGRREDSFASVLSTPAKGGEVRHRANEGRKGALQRQDQPKSRKLPASSWQAMSAMAGGSITVRQTQDLLPTKSPPNEQVQGQTAPQQQDIAKQRSGATDSLREIITVSAEASKETPSIGDQLAENLIAQSLDLPPKAAKWRQSQRAKQERPRLMVQAPEAAWQIQDDSEENLTSTLRSLLGNPQQEFDVRERTFAILERDRGDAWESKQNQDL